MSRTVLVKGKGKVILRGGIDLAKRLDSYLETMKTEHPTSSKFSTAEYYFVRGCKSLPEELRRDYQNKYEAVINSLPSLAQKVSSEVIKR